MFNEINSKTLWRNAPIVKTCQRCGDDLPLEIGDKVNTCRQWASLTIQRCPGVPPMGLIMDLSLYCKLCDLACFIRNQIAHVNEPELQQSSLPFIESK